MSVPDGVWRSLRNDAPVVAHTLPAHQSAHSGSGLCDSGGLRRPMERSSASDLASGLHRQPFGRSHPPWTAGGVVGDDASADQLLGLLLHKVDDRHAHYEREYNDRFTQIEAAQDELARRISAVRLLALRCLHSPCSS